MKAALPGYSSLLLVAVVVACSSDEGSTSRVEGLAGSGGVSKGGRSGAAGSANRAGSSGVGGVAGAISRGGGGGSDNRAGTGGNDSVGGQSGSGPTCEGERCPADITFYAFGDCQYGGGHADKNNFHVEAMNNFAGTAWPKGMPSAGTAVATPRGVLMAGDITQSGRDGRPGDEGTNQLGRFLSDYGLTGKEGRLRFPIYEGYGNHDFDPLEGTTGWRQFYPEPIPPAIQAVIDRNDDRIGLTNVADEGGHYSWDWGGIHFVNTNLYPGNEKSDGEEHGYVRDPYHSLDFLKKDLEKHVGDSCRPVIVMSHYGFKDTPGWWTEEQKKKFVALGRNYNIIAYIHGHNHNTTLYTWEGMDVFNVGSPYYDTGTNPDGFGHFSVFRIHDDVFEAADVAWDPKVKPARAQFVSPTKVSPNMGWRLSKTFKRSCED